MKRLLKLLARLYPSSWRNRYAAEYDALLDDRAPRLRDTFDVLLGALKMQVTTLSSIRITLASCLFGLIAALAISFAVPPKYVSQTLILMDARADGTNHPTANVARDDIGPILANMNRDVLSSESLTPIIQKYNLYSAGSSTTPSEAEVDEMRRNISLQGVRRPTSSPGLPGFVLNFSYPDPHIAQQVDADLVSLFTAANLRRRQNSAEAGHPEPGLTFTVLDAPNLPKKPSFPKRSLFGAGGLLAGLAAGLLSAAILRSHRNQTPANS